MSKFETNIKTCYTKASKKEAKEIFVSPYSSKNAKKMITGANRSAGKIYASKVVK